MFFHSRYIHCTCIYTLRSQVSLPSVDRYPGEYEFAVNISPCSKRVPNFSRELNTLFIHNQTSFAVEFHMLQEELPPNMYVRAMVCYSDPAHLAEHGPILPCSCNAHVSSRSKSVYVHCVTYMYLPVYR